MTPDTPRGRLYVVSAPSGVGKTTLIHSVLTKLPFVRFSISCTTRSPRAGEVPGTDYHFLEKQEFQKGIQTNRFLEWAKVHDEYYGTDGEQVAGRLREGDDVLLDIDVQGARQVRCIYPDCLTIFILPPSLAVLEERLRNRGTESPRQLVKRMSAAHREIMEAPWYDFLIVNDRLQDAATALESIFHAQRCRRSRQSRTIIPFLLKENP